MIPVVRASSVTLGGISNFDGGSLQDGVQQARDLPRVKVGMRKVTFGNLRYFGESPQ